MKYNLPDSMVKYDLQRYCIGKAIEWAGGTLASEENALRTPQSTKELANMLRDPAARLQCPFGTDFESDRNPMEPKSLNGLNPTISRWLAFNGVA